VAIAAGNTHSLALKADGTVVVWGDNSYGQLNVPAGLSGIDLIGVGWAASHIVVVDKRTP
jgi:alpha-tubulin suppressor-like RCC1 family protein